MRLLSILLLVTSLEAADAKLTALLGDGLTDHPLIGKIDTAPAQRLELILAKAGSQASDRHVHIWLRGQEIGFAWATDSNATWNPQVVQTTAGGYWGLPCGLHYDGKRLHGAFFMGGHQLYEIDVSISNTSASGTWTLTGYENSKSGPVQANGKTDTGSVTGTLLDQTALADEQHALASDASFNGWRNNGDGIGHETGAALISHPTAAKVVWKSEAFIPLPYSEGNNLRAPIIKIAGGHASPIAAEGLIFQSFFLGSGRSLTYAKAAADAAMEKITKGDKKGRKAPPFPEAMVQRKFSDFADQVIVAIDARSGATVWQQVFEDDGPNLTAHGRTGLTGPDSKSPSHITPCYGDGRIYAKGTGRIIYALEAKTGKVVWTSGNFKAPQKAGDWLKNGPTDAPFFAAGKVIHMGGNLVALDAATGKRAWTLPGRDPLVAAGGRGVTPIRWQFGTQELIITPGGACLNPADGKPHWAVEVGTGYSKGISIDDKHLIYIGAKGLKVFAHQGTQGTPTSLGSFDTVTFPRNVWPALDKGHLYCRGLPKGYTNKNGDWRTFCVDVTTGKIVGEGFGSKSYASVIGGDGLIFSCSAVSVIASRADPANFGDLHDVTSEGLRLGPADHGSPHTYFIGCPEATAIYLDGRLYCRQFDGIVCYDLRK